MGMRLKLWALFSHIKTFKTFLPHAANCSHLVTSESKKQLPRHFGQQSKRCPAASSKCFLWGQETQGWQIPLHTWTLQLFPCCNMVKGILAILYFNFISVIVFSFDNLLDAWTARSWCCSSANVPISLPAVILGACSVLDWGYLLLPTTTFICHCLLPSRYSRVALSLTALRVVMVLLHRPRVSL